MGKTSFENLRVYELSEQLGDRIWNIVVQWDWLPLHTVGVQLIKATDSVGANIAEGVGRFHLADNRRFALIARGSLYETRHWLRRAFVRKLIDSRESAEVAIVLDNLSKALAGYIRSLSTRVKASSL